jgi:hypothetical protein
LTLASLLASCYPQTMKALWMVMTGWILTAPGYAQQNQASLTPNVPQVQAAGATTDRPGGISYVTRQRSTAGAVNLANSFWAAGGVPVVSATGTAGASATSQVNPGVAAVKETPKTVDPRIIAALRQRAARGDAAAQKALVALAGNGR